MSRWTAKQVAVFVDELAGKNLSEIKQAVADLEPPYPPKLLNALQQEPRAGAAHILRELRGKQLAATKVKQRVARMLQHEHQARAEGFEIIAGVDEVGRGCLAGPVVAAAVILPPSLERLPGINDSKMLTDARRREVLALLSAAADIGVGVVSFEEIDRVNIHRANLLAMKLAIEDLARVPDLVLTDGRHQAALDMPQRTIVKGDRLSMSIAAASIVAKVVRDQMMLEFDRKYPQYHFAQNKGYGTAEHVAALKEHGVSPIHRRSFAPVKECLNPLLL